MDHSSNAHDAAVASGGKCPIDHSSPAPKEVIPSTALPAVDMARMRQVLSIWARPEPFLKKARATHGSRFRVTIIPGVPLYVISAPEDVKQMFLAPRDVLHTGSSNTPIEKWTGQNGLAWLDEEEHTARRRSVMPSFRGDALKRVEKEVYRLAKETVASWPRDRAFAVHRFAHHYTTKVILEVLFGEHRPVNEDAMFEEVMKMLEFNSRPSTMKPFHMLPDGKMKRMRLFRPNGVNEFLTRRARVHAMVDAAIEQRERSGAVGDDLLGVMLGITNADGTKPSRVEMRDEIMTQFLAGTETTASAICWAMEYLTHAPHVVERLREEMAEGAGDKYLTAVVHEVLRLGPPIQQIVPREVVKPIEIGGVRYQPGDRLWASAYLLNRDEHNYPQPDEFKPERFLGVKPASHTWIPFGGGHTRCLGDRVALMELKATLTEILTTCDVERADAKPESAHSRTVVNIPRNGARMVFRPRRATAGIGAG
ncbi:cytochrome P450 [Streptomyces cucumeris]|uniref:cytochrome P450 n=1 Tax=Streptomyces cucumeris TaxID=2962890 RepID=UPI0020C8F151|nr:cytochrome P450 [Streptomyces sp. NEAU-Y11]MCP9212333.1 cytochrome P450 [Streptomyces sp. NEAU-Y11]